MPKGEQSAYERVFLGIAITVTVVWAIATLVQVVSPTHQVPTYANLVMMTVAGSFFGGAVIAGRKRNGNGNGNGSQNSPPPPAKRSLMDDALQRAQETRKRR